MISKVTNLKSIKPLFADWNETIVWSCVQGVMGNVYTDQVENPMAAAAILGDFCFFAGTPSKELVQFPVKENKFLIMVPQSTDWSRLIEDCYGERAVKVLRYAIKKEPEVFSLDHLTDLIMGIPEGYEVKMIDESVFGYCKKEGWAKDLVSQFSDFATYHKMGLGVVVLKDGVPVSGASSYCVYEDGIEIEIDTREEFRRQGLATVCGARLILACLNRGLYPSWDAQNKNSVALAQKLGYHYDKSYVAYEVTAI